MKRFSEFLRIIVFFWRSRLSIDAKKKEKDGEKIECAPIITEPPTEFNLLRRSSEA